MEKNNNIFNEEQLGILRKFYGKLKNVELEYRKGKKINNSYEGYTMTDIKQILDMAGRNDDGKKVVSAYYGYMGNDVEYKRFFDIFFKEQPFEDFVVDLIKGIKDGIVAFSIISKTLNEEQLEELEKFYYRMKKIKVEKHGGHYIPGFDSIVEMASRNEENGKKVVINMLYTLDIIDWGFFDAAFYNASTFEEFKKLIFKEIKKGFLEVSVKTPVQVREELQEKRRNMYETLQKIYKERSLIKKYQDRKIGKDLSRYSDLKTPSEELEDRLNELGYSVSETGSCYKL